MSTTKLAVSGMTCDACVRNVERRLRSIPGVQSVKVNLRSGEALVESEEEKVQPADLVGAVSKLGYQAAVK